ncbi:MAG TPA: beta-1,3-glucanase family protein [Candidatus Omnitrophota bacterium]|nr:beta-1,3-glucanase family protein [Candidatus Omnitrophota bacterium]
MKKSVNCILVLLSLSMLVGCAKIADVSTTPPGPLPDLYITLNFANNSGYAASRFHVMIKGKDASGVEKYFDLSQEPLQFTDSTPPDVTLDTLIARGNVTVPYINSGRIYLALDKQVGAEQADFNQQSVSDGKVYDKIELTVMNTGNVVNLTQVDYFAIPIKITCGAEVRGFNDGITRKQIFDEYAAMMTGDWANLLLHDNTGKRLRILNPEKVIPVDTANFPALLTYWDAIINQYWAAGNSVTILTDETVRRQITGTADGSKIDFGVDGAYVKPTSLQMFGQEVAGGSKAEVVKWVSGAVNRGVIQSAAAADQGDSSKFYSASSADNGGVYNKYAEFFHNSRYSINGRAYALAFDDVFGYESAINIPNKAAVTIQVQGFE